MKYRKKQVVIEAFRFGHDTHEPEWFRQAQRDGRVRVAADHVEIVTLEGVMVGHFGDWIIRGIKDELYPCKPDIFEDSYECA